jgi:superfamily II DNA or RNA helicase
MTKGIQLFESPTNEEIEKRPEFQIEELDSVFEKMDPVETSQILSNYLNRIFSKGLAYYRKDEFAIKKQIAISNQLIDVFKDLVEDQELESYRITRDELFRGFVAKKIGKEVFQEMIPFTSVARTSLFTGGKEEPMVYHELKKEIRTADRIDLLVSFIKFSGLRLIYDDLVEFTKARPLRVITTSYMGASDFEAIKKLAELPNTTIKVSYDTKRTRLHAKAYYFHRETGFSTAYIGSSNMSKAALSEGTEWNLKISEYNSKSIIEKYCMTFETYWHIDEFREFCAESRADCERLRGALRDERHQSSNMVFFDAKPYGYQQEILDRLEIERKVHGSFKNLLVAATGTGKTIISAFDFKRFYKEKPHAKFLFLAHRKEILDQSMQTYRQILRDQNFGELWVAGYRPSQHKHIFASIQTLNAGEKYLQFGKMHFDYIVLDETHHAAAATYEKMLQHFEPVILLGLTATPERMDGKNILRWFNDRMAYELRLDEAIERNMLCPFHYFGVSDSSDVDLNHLKWVRGSYDTQELAELYMGSQARGQTILNAITRYLPSIDKIKGLGFCVNKAHAAFMSQYFNQAGIASIHLDSDSPWDQRNQAKKQLVKGDVQFIFVVDLYNEGVDIPEVNTVLFLRPTESSTVFIQQLGRGLRLSEEKEVVTVLDFIGQAHKQYDYRKKFSVMIGRTRHSMKKELEAEFPSVPRNCYIQLERVAKKRVLDNLAITYLNITKLRRYVENFKFESLLPFTVGNFLTHFQLSHDQLYKSTTLMELRFTREHLISKNRDYESLRVWKAGMSKLGDLDSLEWINFLLSYLNDPVVLNQRERRMLLMIYYTFYHVAPKQDIHTYMKAFIVANPDIRNEMMELLLYRKDQIDHLPKQIQVEEEIPLELHACYTTAQVLTAFGIHTEERMALFREGVKYVAEYHSDLFFITLKKSSSDYKESTLYEDYAISETLFHWQSQSRTSRTSSTGKRYLLQRENGLRVLLFVRESREDGNRHTMPYRCLGLASIQSDQGSKPISIVYELEEGMPKRIFQESNQAVKVV